MVSLNPQQLCEQLSATRVFNEDSLVQVAYSGGPDSTVLLHLLRQLQQSEKFRLQALHVNHGIHPAADQWQQHCASFCQSLDVPFATTRVSLTSNKDRVSEQSARLARYGWFADQMETDALLLTAHHRGDQVETFFLNLMRGAGPRGLSAIQRVQKFSNGWLLRPLLNVDRTDIVEYATCWNLPCLDDPANEDRNYDRNYLRHVVLPTLTDRWPHAIQQIDQSVAHVGQSRLLLEELAEHDLKRCQVQVCTYLSSGEPLSVDQLKSFSEARQINLIRHWTRQRVQSEPGRRALDEFIQTALIRDKKFVELAWASYRVFRYQKALFVTHAPMPTSLLPPVKWDLQQPLTLEQAGIRLVPVPRKGTGLNAELLSDGVFVRFRNGAEKVILPGRQHSSSLKKVLQANAVPPWERSQLPLIFYQTQLVAVVPWLIAGPFQAKDDDPGIVIKLEKL